MIALISLTDELMFVKDKNNTLKIAERQRMVPSSVLKNSKKKRKKSNENIGRKERDNVGRFRSVQSRGILSAINGMESTVSNSNRNNNNNNNNGWGYAGQNGYYGDGGVYQNISEKEQKELEEVRERERRMRKKDKERYDRVGRHILRDRYRDRNRYRNDRERRDTGHARRYYSSYSHSHHSGRSRNSNVPHGQRHNHN